MAHKLHRRQQAMSDVAVVRVAELYLQGIPVAEIAEQLGIKKEYVYKVLRTAREQWKEAAGRASLELRDEQLAKLDKLEAEAWSAWQRSKKIAIETVNEKSQDKFGPKSKSAKRRIYRDGDPRFLELAMRAIDKRVQLLGMLKPESEIGSSNTPLLEVVVSTRDEAAKMLPYMDFAKSMEQPAIEADEVNEVDGG